MTSLAWTFTTFVVMTDAHLRGDSSPPLEVCSTERYRRTWRELVPLIYDTLPGRVLGPIYQFGVFTGDSMNFLRRQPTFNDTFMYGFDSFEGIPEEADGYGTQKNFRQGTYNSGDIRDNLTKDLGGPKHAAFVKGFFNVSLTHELVQKLGMRPAAYIDIDSDLTISAKQALSWIFENGLAVPGTLIGYDDWWVNACSRGGEMESPLESGEGIAHKEIAEEFGVVFRCVGGGCQTSTRCQAFAPIFAVEKILGKNVRGGDHGFYMNSSQISSWKANDFLCQKVLVGKFSEKHFFWPANHTANQTVE